MPLTPGPILTLRAVAGHAFSNVLYEFRAGQSLVVDRNAAFSPQVPGTVRVLERHTFTAMERNGTGVLQH